MAFLFLAIPAGMAAAGEAQFDVPAFGGFPESGGGSPFAALGDKTEKPLLTVSLTPEYAVVAPGVPFKISLTLEHRPGSYSYWTNPGGPGMGTKTSWTLPEGFSISGPEWAAPELYENGGMFFYVYKGKASLIFTVMPPRTLKPGTRLEFKTDINTQICTPRSCTPMRLEAATQIVAAGKPGNVNQTVVQAARDLPASPAGWRFEAADYDGELIIGMYPEDGSNPDPQEVYFFDSAAKPFVDSQQGQKLEKEGAAWWLRLPRLPGPSRVGETLSGVLRSGNGWLEGQTGPADFRVDLPIIAEGAGLPSGLQRPVERQPWVLLLFAFLGGLLLNVMPCVFPVIGLKIMGFAKQAHKERRAVFLHGLSYTAGVLLCFWALSFLVITMGRGWGAQLQSEWFMLAMCHIFMIMSLNMAGVFEVGASVAGAGQSLTGREGLKRSFFTGLLATLTSTPCSAPFLGTALAYALALPPLMSLGVFTLMGLGFSFPYLALSLFPNWLKKLPKPGAWMETFRQAMSFPLFATTAYLFWTMEAMMDEWRFLLLLFGLVLTAMACWLYGKHQKSVVKRPRAGKILFACAVASLAAGIWLGWPKAGDSLEWGEWSPEAVARLRDEGRPVYVDFTARWCATCQVNKRVYSSKKLQELIERKEVALLKADWTQYDDRITTTLRDEFDKAAVPVNVLYAPGEPHGFVLPDILTVDNVSQALERLPES